MFIFRDASPCAGPTSHESTKMGGYVRQSKTMLCQNHHHHFHLQQCNLSFHDCFQINTSQHRTKITRVFNNPFPLKSEVLETSSRELALERDKKLIAIHPSSFHCSLHFSRRSAGWRTNQTKRRHLSTAHDLQVKEPQLQRMFKGTKSWCTRQSTT